MKDYDIIVIGSGPGGYVAAIRAAQIGLKVAVVEARHLGGICLNWGCIPTKALLKCSEINYMLSNLENYGFSASDIKFDFQKIIDRSRKVANQLAGGVKSLLKKNKIEVIEGFGKITGKGEVSVLLNNEIIKVVKTKYIIIASGARARHLKGFEPDGSRVWSYREAMIPNSLPKSLIVVGSGAIGSEFANFYANMGAEVTLLEAKDSILPMEDEEISSLARLAFEKQGIKIETGITLETLEQQESGVILHYNGKILEAEKIIMAVGIIPNTENIGLDSVGIKMDDKGFIQTDKFMKTNISGIFAIGDVTEGPWLAHKASHEGVIAAEKIACELSKYEDKKLHSLTRVHIPGCTYTRPQIASVGLTEKEALKKGYDIKIGRFKPIGNGKSVAVGESEGLVKTIFDASSGELLGAHMIGAEVTELISTFVLGKQVEAVEEDFFHTVFPHPSLSEMIHESVLDAYNKVIHS